MSILSLKLIRGTDSEMAALQRVFEEAPGYSERMMGHPPGPAEAQSTYTILPSDIGYEDKFVYGIFFGEKMVGCVDLIRGYPDKRTAMLGLLLLSESAQRKGLGRRAFELVESRVQNWSGIEKIRIGIVRTNEGVIPFWTKMGFVDTGVRKPYRYDKLESEHLIFEKKISSSKSRYTMRAALQSISTEEKWSVRPISPEDAPELGKLMERAYRNTIDDEGESVEQFIAETTATLHGKWGKFVPEASFLIRENDRPVSATIVTLWKDKPLLAYSVTDPEFQGRGMGAYLIRRTMNALNEAGYSHLELGVTLGNDPAEHLYRKLGFERVP